MQIKEGAAAKPGRSTINVDPNIRFRKVYSRPCVTAWGAIRDLTNGGPAAGSDDSMTGSTTFGFLFFGTDEWHLFGGSNNR